ncbi:GntR family transcriptional regulator [Kordiimonas pumila]|uniref:GntR family transcriptional regulator n=1 Tax=Kordiimonas pumila TaxID=2161677 RepID=A0ABV7D862_9PROT|nr:GntR family transcriptional regulator [Kordiimonas pumila]
MKLDSNLITPLEKTDGRRAVVEIHDIIRDLILSGRLAPNTVLSQVELSRLLGVSRTPVREALRMLQEGGLVGAEPNFRNRVLGFDPKDIEALYMKRIMMESLGVVLTTQRMTDKHVAELSALLEALEGDESHSSFTTWIELHRRLHSLVVAEAGAAFVADLEALELRSERYQSAYKGAHFPGWWQRGEVEHREIFEAMAARDASKAAELAARHLARTALELLAALAPEYDTSRIRESLRFALTAAAAMGEKA